MPFKKEKIQDHPKSRKLRVVWELLEYIKSPHAPGYWKSESLQYLTLIIETKSVLGKISGNSGMVHLAEINQAPSTYSMFRHIGRVATPKLVPRNCLRYLQTTLIMGGGEGLVSEFMWGIA